MRYDFDPYDGADIMDSRDINEYLEDLIDEVSCELQETFKISDDDAIMFLAQYEEMKDNDGTIPERSKREMKIIDRIYTAMDNVGMKRKKQWDDEGRLDKIKDLQDLIAQNSGGDWDHGTTLIKDDYFPEYAKELAEDIGAINDDSRWPNNCIDWEQAADELLMDYTSCEIGGETYYYRQRG